MEETKVNTLKRNRHNDSGSTGSSKIEIPMFFGIVNQLNKSKVNFIMKVIE
jgi:hypothetical protein